MTKRSLKILTLYLLGITVIFFVIWGLLDTAFPQADLNLLRALSAAFSINVPENILQGHLDARLFMIVFGVAGLSVGMILLHVYFGAFITASMINPEVKVIFSSRGVLSTAWNPKSPYILVRMSNFDKRDLLNVEIKAVITVEETRMVDGKTEQFLSYLPVEDVTPAKILILTRFAPWSIAVPGDAHLGNSLTGDYHFKPGVPIVDSFSPGKKIVSCKRNLEILIAGAEPRSYAQFVKHQRIRIDEQNGDVYTLHLHKGSFKSLPMAIASSDLLEQFA